MIDLTARATTVKEFAIESFIMQDVIDVVWDDINKKMSLICQGTLVLQVIVMVSEIRYLEFVLSVIQPITCASLL